MKREIEKIADRLASKMVDAVCGMTANEASQNKKVAQAMRNGEIDLYKFSDICIDKMVVRLGRGQGVDS